MRETDIFSLGVLAHVLLTDREPHETFGSMETLRSTLQNDPPLPSSMTHQPIPTELDQLVQACQHRSPDHRPCDINELLQKLLIIADQCPWDPSDTPAPLTTQRSPLTQ